MCEKCEGQCKETADSQVIGVNLMKEEFDAFEYDLPDFYDLARDFDVEKAYEKESSFLLREVRKTIAEKLGAYLHLFETFMNPGSSPMFIFSVLRGLSDEDKSFVRGYYKKLSDYQLESLKLDTVYDEAKEAEFIRRAFDDWQGMKSEIYQLIEKLEGCSDVDEEGARSEYLC